MKRSTLSLFVFCVCFQVCAQYQNADLRAAQIPDSVTGNVASFARYLGEHFPDATERTRVIYVWMAGHIQYDIDNMFAINFYADSTEKISKPLLTHKGICENYASLFTSLCNRSGIQSVVVVGYTLQKGFADYIPHAWSVARVDGEWRIFDPTWGSGFIQDKKFIRKLNNDYFMPDPGSFIRNHMPFDYLWQLSYYPVTNQEFYEGKIAPDKTKPYFNYPDSIAAWLALPAIEQERAEAVRVERNGVRNSMVFDRLQHLKVDLENYRRQQEMDRQNGFVTEYNTALEGYNDAIKQFNVFVAYRNDQFRPAKPDTEIQQMLDSADHLAAGARVRAAAIPATEEKVSGPARKLVAAIDELTPRIAEQQAWLKKYLGKGKLARKMMFYK